MDATSPSILQDQNGRHIAIVKDSSLRMAFSAAYSLFFFTYSLTGWEGSSSDARVFEDAITSDLVIPPGYYLLADAGFPHCKELLIPYQGKHYHLQEWG